jgi:hypothetical protein
MNEPDSDCWFCGGRIFAKWKVKLSRGKIYAGAYCSRECANNDAWGPKYRNAIVFFDGRTKKQP